MGEETNLIEIQLGRDIVCRNCHEIGGTDLIAPCLCSGSIKYAHRKCLNAWRAYSPNPLSFTNCDVCGFKYEFKERDEVQTSIVWKFGLYVARDFFGALLIVQIIVLILSVIIFFGDSHRTLSGLFPATWSIFGVYYLYGLFTFSLVVAIYGGFFLLYRLLSGSRGYPTSYDTYPYYFGPYYYWFCYPSGYSCCPPCYCTECGGIHCSACLSSVTCGNPGNNNTLTVAGLIILIIAVVTGLIVMVVIATVVLRRHANILQKEQLAREKDVVNLEDNTLDIESL